MKKLLSLALLASIAFPVAGFAQGLKFGTIDANRVIKEYSKTKDSEQKLNDAQKAMQKEYEDRFENYKKAGEDIKKLSDQLETPALSADAKTQRAKERDEKITSLKNMEREISEFYNTRKGQLQAQAGHMREAIVQEITDVVMERVKANNLDLVFDKSGPSINGIPVVMYARDNVDFTNDIIATLNKPGRVSSAPAASPAASAAATASPTKPKP